MLNQVRMSITDGDSSPPWFATLTLNVCVLLLVVALYYPSGLVTWCLVHVLGRKSMFDEMQAAVQGLSPLVEERSGCRLRLEWERDGRLGGTAAYVYFEPRSGVGGDGGGVGGGGSEGANPATDLPLPSSSTMDGEDAATADPRRPLVHELV